MPVGEAGERGFRQTAGLQHAVEQVADANALGVASTGPIPEVDLRSARYGWPSFGSMSSGIAEYGPSYVCVTLVPPANLNVQQTS